MKSLQKAKGCFPNHRDRSRWFGLMTRKGIELVVVVTGTQQFEQICELTKSCARNDDKAALCTVEDVDRHHPERDRWVVSYHWVALKF